MTDPRKQLADLDAEAAVLSAMLMEHSAVAQAVEILSPDDFTTTGNRIVFAGLVTLGEGGTEPDPIALAALLESRGELSAAGGRERIGELIEYVTTAANVSYHARIVRELSERRRLIAVAADLSRAAADRSVDLTETGRATVEQLLPVATSDQGSHGFHRADLWSVMREIERRAKGDTLPGLLTGFPELDDVVSGFRPGELVIVGGVAKGGKTALALNIARNAMTEREARVAFVSAEMSEGQLIERLLSAQAVVPVSRISSGRFWDSDYPRMATAAGQLARCRLYIDDAALPSLDDIRARSLALVANEGPVDLLIVDFLQLVRHTLKGRRGDEELTAIAYGLKGIAKRLGCVVIAPCQLNYKDVERRANTRPAFADLAGSSGMMQAADCVMLTHRQAMYDPSADDDMEITVRGRRMQDFAARLKWDGTHMRVLSPRRIADEQRRKAA